MTRKKTILPDGAMGLGELAYILRIDRQTLQMKINRAIKVDLGGTLGTKSIEQNPEGYARLQELAQQGLGEVQSGKNFPRGLCRIKGRWFFTRDNVKGFLERRAVMAQLAAKTAAQDLRFFKDKYGYDQD